MATVTAPSLHMTDPESIVLHDVSWEMYCQLRDPEANNSIRMTYLDGELILMSPEIEHDGNSQLLGQLIRAVTVALGLEIRAIGSTTLRRETALKQGAGKEPDAAFFIGDDERRMRGRWKLDLSVDPPPTLAIEVDHSKNSAVSLAVYARLGVPEVWRFQTRDRTLWMGRLVGDTYQVTARSVALPRLTPTRIIEALDRFDVGDMGENAWFEWVKAWARGLPEPEVGG